MEFQGKLLRTLGNTDIRISAIGLGCWQFSAGKGMGASYWSDIPDQQIIDIIRLALEGGINWFDTAEFYGHGTSEKNLSNTLQALDIAPGKAVIATKWWPIMKFAGNLHKTIGDRIDCLSPYPIDLYMVHQPYSLSSIDAQMNTMADLLDAGHIRSIGVSNFSAKAMLKAHTVLEKRGYGLACNQMRYSLMFRQIENNHVLTTAKDIGTTIIAWSPLEQGMLSGKFHHNPELVKGLGIMRKSLFSYSSRRIAASRPLIEALERISEKHSASVAQVALNWLIHYHGDTVVAIPGATKASQVEQNTGAMNFTLNSDEMQEIDSLSQQFI